MMLPDPYEFRAWQIEYYTQRLNEARSTEEKSFLRSQLYHLKKPANGNRAATTNDRSCRLLVMQTNNG
jgi:hypothetical protein